MDQSVEGAWWKVANDCLASGEVVDEFFQVEKRTPLAQLPKNWLPSNRDTWYGKQNRGLPKCAGCSECRAKEAQIEVLRKAIAECEARMERYDRHIVRADRLITGLVKVCMEGGE